jgi:hypothetical protein
MGLTLFHAGRQTDRHGSSKTRREDAKNETLFKTSHFKEYCCSERKARREKKAIEEYERYSLIPRLPFRIKEQIMHFLRTNTISLSLNGL